MLNTSGCAFSIIKENNRIWIATHLLAELSALLVTNISWRRTVILETLCFLHAPTYQRGSSHFPCKHRLRVPWKALFSDTRRPRGTKTNRSADPWSHDLGGSHAPRRIQLPPVRPRAHAEWTPVSTAALTLLLPACEPGSSSVRNNVRNLIFTDH